jgi:hypothetical protein
LVVAQAASTDPAGASRRPWRQDTVNVLLGFKEDTV